MFKKVVAARRGMRVSNKAKGLAKNVPTLPVVQDHRVSWQRPNFLTFAGDFIGAASIFVSLFVGLYIVGVFQ